MIVAAFGVLGVSQYREKRLVADVKAAQADMRIFALAINTYQMEEGAYPPPDAGGRASRTGGRLPIGLTTPVAYVNRLLTDPFDPAGAGEPLFYVRREDGATTGTGGDTAFDGFVRDHLGEPVGDVDYVFWGQGPDGDEDTMETGEGVWRTVRYDPTNGSDSDGDLHFWGPAIGIRRNPYLGTAAAGRGGLR